MGDSSYQATWWRAGCEVVDADCESSLLRGPHRYLVPRGRPEAYNPFDFYYPASEALRANRSLPYLFTDLCPDNTDQVKDFCSCFGIPGPFGAANEVPRDERGAQHESTTGLSAPKDDGDLNGDQGASSEPTRALLEQGGDSTVGGSGQASSGRRPIEGSVLRPMSLRTFENEWCKFKNFLLTAQCVKEGTVGTGWITNVDARYRLHDWLKPALEPVGETGRLEGWFTPVPTTVEQARSLLTDMIAEGCGRLQTTITWDTQRKCWMWAWSSSDLLGFMYLMVGMDMQGHGWIRTCTGCARYFLAGRADKHYCSPDCQNRTKAKRYYHEVGKERRAEHGHSHTN